MQAMSSYPSRLTVRVSEIQEHLKLSCKLPTLLQEVMTRRIIADEAKARNITVTLDELQSGSDQLRYINQLQRSEDTYAWLKQHWLTVDDFEMMIHESVLANKLAGHLFADQIEPYFYEHQLDYWSAIFYEVIVQDMDLALELHCALQEEELSFYEVAHQYHSDLEKRRTGGYCGQVRRDSLKPELSAAIFASNPPQLLQPVTSAQGVHLLCVEELIEPILDIDLRAQILHQLFTDWLEQKSNGMQIERIVGMNGCDH